MGRPSANSFAIRKGTTVVLADTLSRAHLQKDDVCEFTANLETMDHSALLAVRKDRLQQIKHATKDNPVLLQLQQMIQRGSRRKCRPVYEHTMILEMN